MDQTTLTSAPPRWGRDPEGHFDLRWHDGTDWTQHVSIQGAQGECPVATTAAHAEAVAVAIRSSLPAAAPPLPSRWGLVPPAPLHRPAEDAPSESGYVLGLTGLMDMTRAERLEVAKADAAARRRARDTTANAAGVGIRMLAGLLDVGLAIGTLGIGYLGWSLVESRHARTPGQRLLGLEVARARIGTRAGWARYALLRGGVSRVLGATMLATVLYAVELSGLVEQRSLTEAPTVVLAIAAAVTAAWWLPALGPRKQAFHDQLAGTVVVRRQPPA